MIPNPGSDAALAIGCRCPVMDNSHGQGIYCLGEDWWISADCPVHWIHGRINPDWTANRAPTAPQLAGRGSEEPATSVANTEEAPQFAEPPALVSDRTAV